MNKEHLKSLIADGKLSQAVEELTQWTKNSAYKDTNTAIVQLAQRHNTNDSNNRLGNSSQSDYLMERNRISLALLEIIENTASNRLKPNWIGIITVAVGLIALIANIGTIKDAFFKKVEPKILVSPAEPKREGVKSNDLPEKPEQAATTNTVKSKNNTQINVKDNGKVGTVINGDSNKADIHQSF